MTKQLIYWETEHFNLIPPPFTDESHADYAMVKMTFSHHLNFTRARLSPIAHSCPSPPPLYLGTP